MVTLPASIISDRPPSSDWKMRGGTIAALIGCQPREIVFVSGGTEADNLALFGTVASMRGARRGTSITTAIEHPAVLNACAQLEREAWP
jgi:cysteine desulfurase